MITTTNFLTNKDWSSIVDALLFSSSTQIQGKWDEDQAKEMFEIAKKIRREMGFTPDEKISFYDPTYDNVYEQPWAGEIKEAFPEIQISK